MRHADVRLSEEENVIPQASLEVVLHLRKVKVGAEASLDQFIRVMVEKEPKVEQGTRHWRFVDGHAWLVEMPTTGSHNEDGRTRGKLVLLAIRLKVNLPTDSITKVDLALDHCLESGRGSIWMDKGWSDALERKGDGHARTLKISHECFSTAIQGIDDHLPIRRTSNFNTPVL